MPVVFSLPLVTWNLLKGEVRFRFIVLFFTQLCALLCNYAFKTGSSGDVRWARTLTPHWLDLRHENDLHETLLILHKEDEEYSMQKAQERWALMLTMSSPKKENTSMLYWGIDGLCWAEAGQGAVWFLYKTMHSLAWFGVSWYISLNIPNWCISWRWNYEPRKERGINSGKSNLPLFDTPFIL